ncbi:hypothetical protein [Salinibacterium sp. SWN167]|uniref:hypothetical protein n=1 Tax=Salinibacterium sp. SWN167 TaxID=2792054 RepID=UPI0018CEBE1D|nr:hypothetical protein [Salinibacterium sp. SWN167]MBH0082223.1 hypothetical protein [Salinibacterium sp. SWN167]
MRTHAVLLAALSLLLSGCSILGFEPSPTTTYTDATGTEVTVDWVNYPAHEGNDGEKLLEYPDQAELESGARELVEQLRMVITDSSGLALTSSEPEQDWFADKNWYPQSGNGYGGESMLITVNCCDFTSDSVPEPNEWQRVLDAASQVTQDAGLGNFVLDDVPEWCADAGDECWRWTGTATDGVQWVFIKIDDLALDPTGDSAQDAEEFDWPLASISFSYGATVVRTGQSDEYADAFSPFLGLKQPSATSSD